MIQILLEPSLSKIDDIEYIVDNYEEMIENSYYTESDMKKHYDDIKANELIENKDHKLRLDISYGVFLSAELTELVIKMYVDGKKKDKLFSILFAQSEIYKAYTVIYMIAKTYLNHYTHKSIVGELKKNLAKLGV